MVDKVSASTQNQAFSALLLLFREILRRDMEEMAQTVRAKRGRKLPTVLSVSEVQALLAAVEPGKAAAAGNGPFPFSTRERRRRKKLKVSWDSAWIYH